MTITTTTTKTNVPHDRPNKKTSPHPTTTTNKQTRQARNKRTGAQPTNYKLKDINKKIPFTIL